MVKRTAGAVGSCGIVLTLGRANSSQHPAPPRTDRSVRTFSTSGAVLGTGRTTHKWLGMPSVLASSTRCGALQRWRLVQFWHGWVQRASPTQASTFTAVPRPVAHAGPGPNPTQTLRLSPRITLPNGLEPRAPRVHTCTNVACGVAGRLGRGACALVGAPMPTTGPNPAQPLGEHGQPRGTRSR